MKKRKIVVASTVLVLLLSACNVNGNVGNPAGDINVAEEEPTPVVIEKREINKKEKLKAVPEEDRYIFENGTCQASLPSNSEISKYALSKISLKDEATDSWESIYYEFDLENRISKFAQGIDDLAINAGSIKEKDLTYEEADKIRFKLNSSVLTDEAEYDNDSWLVAVEYVNGDCYTYSLPKSAISYGQPGHIMLNDIFADIDSLSESQKEAYSLDYKNNAKEEKTANGKETTPYEKITLDGVKDHHFIATDYCYIESEKYILFLEKDIDLPGDFVVNMDAIVDELEVQLDLSSAPADYDYSDLCDMSVYYGFNPWEDWNVGTKIPIFLIVDEKDESLISSACNEFVVLVDWGMFSEELWNSVPGYGKSDFRVRPDHVSYMDAAHELTHVITERNNVMTEILTEGIAEYMSVKVIDELASEYPSIAEEKEDRYLFDNPIPEKVNAENAERIFIEDYNTIGTANRGAEYTYGKYFWQFIDEEYGSKFYSRYNGRVKTNGIYYSYGTYDEEVTTQYADTIKEVFGDDIFEKFGNWCVDKNVLQELNGVFPTPE